jgi:hypothetical protein
MYLQGNKLSAQHMQVQVDEMLIDRFVSVGLLSNL